MGKKTFAFAMALLMALSGFTAVAAVSEESDAASAVQLDRGDAWGAGGHIDLGMLLKAVNDELARQDIVLEIPLEKEELLDYIEDLVNRLPTGYKLSDLNVDVSGDAWNIAEVVEKNSSGYVIEFASASEIKLMLAGKISGMLPSSTEGIDPESFEDGKIPDAEDLDLVQATLNLKELRASSDSLVEGKVYLDANCDLTRVDVSVNTGITVSAESNVSVDKDGNITYGTDTRKSQIVAGCDIDGSVAPIDGAIKFLPDNDAIGWIEDGKVNVSVHGNAYADMPGEMEDYSEGFNDSDTEDFEFMVHCSKDSDGVYTMKVTTDSIDIPEKLKLPMMYKYPFEANYCPEKLLIGDSLKLDSSEKKTVWKNIDDVSGDFGDAMADKDCTVRFTDDDGKVIESLTQTVKYGKTIVLPEYPSASPMDEDEVFIGWETENDVIWKNEYPVKYNMVLEAEFADKVADTPGEEDFAKNPSVLWQTTVDKIDRALDNGMFSDGRTLYISVSDADGNVLYKWKIGTGNPGETVTAKELNAQIQKADVPDREYLKEAAGGNDAVYLDFKASGAMPSKTVVSYYVGDVFEDGDSVTIYYDDTENGSAVNSGSSVVIGGYVDIPLKHCSSYMLVAEGPAPGESGSSLMLIVGVLAVVIVAAVAVFFVMRKKGVSIQLPAKKP